MAGEGSIHFHNFRQVQGDPKVISLDGRRVDAEEHLRNRVNRQIQQILDGLSGVDNSILLLETFREEALSEEFNDALINRLASSPSLFWLSDVLLDLRRYMEDLAESPLNRPRG